MLKAPKLGIVQGRLTTSPNGVLQHFPQNEWQREFVSASSIGFHYIEFFAERQHNEMNPIWSGEGLSELLDLSQNYGIELYSICNDYTIEHNVAEGRAPVEQTEKLIKQAASLGMKKLVLPLLEQSEVQASNLKIFIKPLREIADAAAERDMWICLETVADCESLLELLKLVERPNVGICFDTGNRVVLGHDLSRDIVRLGSSIHHVHIKDKDLDGNNVFLGTGEVNFYRVIEALSSIKYKGGLTFETCRGRHPVRTARYHKTFLEFFIGELSAEQS